MPKLVDDIKIEKIEGTDLSRVLNVPIVSTGINYELSTGYHSFTQHELVDAVAALEDPAIHDPRLGLGHSDKRFNGDGQPALGRAENLRLDGSGHTIIGDYVTYDWLAAAVPIAYPNKSIEADLNVQTVTGNRWRMVLKAVKLLGITWPGCSTLDDLPILLSAKGPEGVTAEEGGAMGLAASVNVDDVRMHFYKTIQGDDSKRWWWIRAMLANPTDLIVDDGEGALFRVSYTVGDDEVSFGDPVAVSVEYPDVPANVAAGLVTAGLAASQGAEDVVVYASREQSRPAEPGGDMDRAKIAASLGLPETATEGEINAAIVALRASTAEEPKPDDGNGDPEPGTEEDPKPGTEEPEEGEKGNGGHGDPEPAVEVDASSTVTIDRATFEELRRNSGLAAKHEAERLKASDEGVVDAAIRDGKFAPSRREHWLKLMAADRDGTTATINELQAGAMPVGEVGIGRGGDGDSLEASSQGLPDSWFPNIGKIREQAAKHRQVVQAREG